MLATRDDFDGQFSELVAIMQRLRGPGGCPWDLKQSFDTIKAYLLEETYEVMDAIDHRDWPALADELGDLLLQPVFLAQMASEAGYFSIADCLTAINAKLIRRHPHIFANAEAATAEDVKRRWDEIKAQEQLEKGTHNGQRSVLDSVLRSFPALVEASKLSKKAAGEGFEWPDIHGVIDKLREEAVELAEARQSSNQEDIEHEIGDMFFTLVNLARFLHIDPEQALRKTNQRFRERFGYIEAKLSEKGLKTKDAGLQQMEDLWQEAKRRAQEFQAAK
ncbi:MAG TPA: nucleoside triphosphate pyrophosphohydrolase [Bryobacteraceae bacterium]|nr:nucleoside triphosphate pyrophosphohydrolase [Bryobacteraceae bacterium]